MTTDDRHRARSHDSSTVVIDSDLPDGIEETRPPPPTTASTRRETSSPAKNTRTETSITYPERELQPASGPKPIRTSTSPCSQPSPHHEKSRRWPGSRRRDGLPPPAPCRRAPTTAAKPQRPPHRPVHPRPWPPTEPTEPGGPSHHEQDQWSHRHVGTTTMPKWSSIHRSTPPTALALAVRDSRQADLVTTAPPPQPPCMFPRLPPPET